MSILGRVCLDLKWALHMLESAKELRHEPIVLVISDHGPVFSLEILRESINRHALLLAAYVLLACLEVSTGNHLQSVIIILANLGSLYDWLAPFISRKDHVALRQMLLRG